jgi:hypothetical protein
MPSNAYTAWTKSRAEKLDQIEKAHASVGGLKRGRRYATDQINQAYVVLLASQFQAFCRDLHSECVVCLVDCIEPASMKPLVKAELTRDRKLDKGNANSGTLGSDFGRLGVDFIEEVKRFHAQNSARKERLDVLNQWRNAIAHQDFDPEKLGDMRLHLKDVRRWRKTCNKLARAFDAEMRSHIEAVTGCAPWA